MRALVREFFSLEAESPSFPWIDQVPNAPNPGDGPSRISLEEVMTFVGRGRLQCSGASGRTHFTLDPIQPVFEEGVKIPTSWNVETKNLGATHQ